MAKEPRTTKTLPELGLNERQLILNCARLELDGRLLEQTKTILDKPITWDVALFYAKYHSVASLIYRNLKILNKLDLVPREANRSLLQLCHRNEYQNRLLSIILHDLLEKFSQADVPLIVPKGISLVELIYGHFNLRPLIDINLLVPENKIDTAKKLLLASGYANLLQDPSQGRLFSQLHLFKRGELEVHVLLQWHLVNWPKIQSVDMTRVWRDAQTVRLSGRDALIPSAPDLVLYLCTQPDKRSFLNLPALCNVDPKWFVFTELTNNRLIRFVDIYEVVRYFESTLDWRILIERAGESGLQGPLHTSLKWVTELMGPVVEPWVLDALQSPSPRPIRRWLFEALIPQSTSQACASTVKSRFRIWWLKKRLLFRDRTLQLLNILEFMFPRRDELRLFYGLSSGTMLIAYYPFHCVWTFFLGLLPWMYRVLFKERLSMIYSRKRPD